MSMWSVFVLEQWILGGGGGGGVFIAVQGQLLRSVKGQMSRRMRSVTDYFFGGLTQMAGMKRSADCLSSDSSGGSTVKKSKGRQVIKSTFVKWQREHEREHRTLTWPRCELDRDRVHVAS